VAEANICINNQQTAAIKRGILALIGIEKVDEVKDAEKIFSRIINYRIFPDDAGKMNHSLLDIQGDLLLVPQFTLVAETNKGTRPGFSQGMPPEEGKKLFDYLVHFAQSQYAQTLAGVFGANMQVNLCNDGPVTFILRT